MLKFKSYVFTCLSYILFPDYYWRLKSTCFHDWFQGNLHTLKLELWLETLKIFCCWQFPAVTWQRGYRKRWRFYCLKISRKFPLHFLFLVDTCPGIDIFVNSYEVLFNFESDGVVVDVVTLNPNCWILLQQFRLSVTMVKGVFLFSYMFW